MKYFVIDEDQLRKLKAASTRLHTENRMNGDEMRDLGHLLADIERVCREFPVPET